MINLIILCKTDKQTDFHCNDVIENSMFMKKEKAVIEFKSCRALLLE